MAISENAVIEFYGTQDTVDSSSAAVSDGAMSVASSVTTWTNDDDALEAGFVLRAQYASGTVDSNAFVSLYARLMNIDGTNDANEPATDHLDVWLGNFVFDDGLATATNTYMSLRARLPNLKSGQEYDFYILNLTGVTLSDGWTLKVTPITYGPHPA